MPFKSESSSSGRCADLGAARGAVAGLAALSVLAAAAPALAAPTVTVDGVTPYAFDTTKTLHYLSDTPATTFYDVAAGFKNVSTTTTLSSGGTTNLNYSTSSQDPDAIEVKVTSNLTDTENSQVVATLYVLASDNTPVAIPLAFAQGVPCRRTTDTGYTSGICQYAPTAAGILANRFVQGIYPATGTEAGTITLGFYAADLCKAIQAQSKSHEFCNNGTGAVDFGTATSANFSIKARVAAVANDTTAVPADDSDTAGGSEQKTLRIHKYSELTFSCPSLDNIYFPGDSEILVNGDAFRDNSTTNPPDTVLVVAAQNNSAPNVTSNFGTQNEVYARLSIGGGSRQTVSGFANSTSEAAVNYRVDFGVRNNAGAIRFQPTGTQVPTGSNTCHLEGVQTAAILGLLKRSSCFIASAAYQDPDAPGVRLLRAFRDRVLLRSGAGRLFVRWYYERSPRAAAWLLRNPTFRYPVLAALVPLQALAWMLLNPLAGLGVALAAAGAGGAAWAARRRRGPPS